jgi:hypothetical protein
MARINQALLGKLEQKLSIRKSRLYKMIEQKMAETHLDRHLAAIVLASENGIGIAKYATSDELAMIRGATSRPSSMSTANPQIVVRKVIKSTDPIVLDLSFISSKELREIIQRDITELNAARSQGLDKTSKICMVLCGSIAEALLLDCLLQNQPAALATASALPKKSSSNLEDWDLNEMVTVATKLELLSDDTSTGATQLRQWRNLIHPGRELKETRNKRIKPTPARAQNSISFLQLIAEELG